ncbi:hypothetical protein NM688_g7613 [Phlebia brevispora]|uniref:Uncharacterized protein n=1 Tax=Phlebia brevispora TaxID=194682 RepID=A0ACC1S3A1_9APHY|nr:hypothetical protein NM688_g7613 [Phlebia brevispora]
MYVDMVLPRSTPTAPSNGSKSHNVATFAGAVGGSVGLLSFLALSLAFSIYRRRTLAARRDRAYRESQRDAASISESFHTDASEDGPPMQGPVPFVPRYFPGTVINTAPPPYSLPGPPSSSPTSALLGPLDAPTPTIAYSSRRFGFILDGDTSYADRPPPTPPLGADVEDGYFPPPPPFLVAISTPVPAILAGLSGVLSAPQSPAPESPEPEPRPSSPVVPLLAPPPSSRPQSLRDETPVAGPSGSEAQPASTVPSSRVSIHSIQISAQAQSLHRQPSNASTRASIRDASLGSHSSSSAATSDSRRMLREVEDESSREEDGAHSTRQ